MSISTFVIIVLYVIEFSVLITLGYISYKMPNFIKGKSQKNPEGDEENQKHQHELYLCRNVVNDNRDSGQYLYFSKRNAVGKSHDGMAQHCH